jgi:hypothetical protein
LIVVGREPQSFRKMMKKNMDNFQFCVMVLLSLAHSNIVYEALQSFPCTKVNGVEYLTADLQVRCDSSEYASHVTIAVFYLLGYGIGAIVLLYFRGLKHNAATKKIFSFAHSAGRKYSYFITGYKEKYYYWEMTVVLRKLAVITTLTFVVTAGAQLALVLMIVSCAFLANILHVPFKNPTLNRLESLSLVTVTLSVVLTMFYRESDGAVQNFENDATINASKQFLIFCLFFLNSVVMFFYLSVIAFKFRIVTEKYLPFLQDKLMKMFNVVPRGRKKNKHDGFNTESLLSADEKEKDNELETAK